VVWGRGIANKCGQPRLVGRGRDTIRAKKAAARETAHNCVSRWHCTPHQKNFRWLQGNLGRLTEDTGLVLFSPHALHLLAAWMASSTNAGHGPRLSRRTSPEFGRRKKLRTKSMGVNLKGPSYFLSQRARASLVATTQKQCCSARRG